PAGLPAAAGQDHGADRPRQPAGGAHADHRGRADRPHRLALSSSVSQGGRPQSNWRSNGMMSMDVRRSFFVEVYGAQHRPSQRTAARSGMLAPRKIGTPAAISSG